MSFADQALGKIFGRLTITGIVTQEGRRKLNYLCECGTVGIVDARMLKAGSTSSCGCLRKELLSKRQQVDLNGRTFVRLTVKGPGQGKLVGKRQQPNSTWVCQCDCGNQIEVTSNALLSGNTRSCGCYARDRAAETRRQEGHGYKTIVSHMRTKAKGRGIGWELTSDFAENLIQLDCTYCGSEPDKLYKELRFTGIDRIDSSRSYSEDNVTPCCTKCNNAKNAMSVDEFKSQIQKIYNHFIKN